MYWIKNEELFLSNDITEIMKKICHTGQNEELWQINKSIKKDHSKEKCSKDFSGTYKGRCIPSQ